METDRRSADLPRLTGDLTSQPPAAAAEVAAADPLMGGSLSYSMAAGKTGVLSAYREDNGAPPPVSRGGKQQHQQQQQQRQRRSNRQTVSRY